MEPSESRQHRALFMVGRDAYHPRAAGGDLQAWQWAVHLASQGWLVEYVAQSAPGLPAEEERDGVRILRRGDGPLLAWRAFRHYRRHAADIDLVYEDPIGSGRTPYLSPLYSRVTVIAVWHQVSADLLRALRPGSVAATMAVVERVLARFYRRSLLWAPSAERAGEVSAELGIPRERIAVVPPTLAHDIVIADAPASTPDQTVLCMGVMRSYKNFEHVVRAMGPVLAQVPQARLVIAGRHGDERYEQALAGEVHALGLGDAVEFRFDVSDDERQRLMRRCAALVLPSLLEGFGIVSIEANAEGTPVIASSGVPVAAVTHEVNGLRYDHGDIPALTGHLVDLLTDQAHRHELGLGAIAHAHGLTVASVSTRFDAVVERAVIESAHRARRRALVSR